MAADPQYIVDQIRAFVAAADQTLTPTLPDLAREYAKLCNEANARLRRCVDHLRRGLRAEAIHLAEEPPPLLELVSILDFPEIPQWANVCAMYELERPPPLLIELAQELNEAYAAAEPTKPWLDLHRRLALEHAPLAERIAVMRELAKLDTASSFWEEDLRLFESTRLKQCRAELPVATKNRDRKALDALQAEVTADGWRVEVPADLKTAVGRAFAVARQDHAVGQIHEWLPQLDAAYGAKDSAAVSGLLDKIRRLAAETKLTLPRDVTDQIDPAEQWVRQQQAKAAKQAEIDDAIAELAQALAEDRPPEALRRLAVEIEQAGGVTPEDLAARVRSAEAREADVKAKQRRQWLGIAAVFVLALVAGGAVAGRAVVRKTATDNAFKTLAGHRSKQDFAAALADLKRFADESPYVLDRADVADLAARVRNDAKANQTRRQQFEAAISVADKAVKDATATGAVTDAVWSAAVTEAKAAVGLAWSADERARAGELLARIKKARDTAVADMDGNYRRLIETCSVKLTDYRAAVDAGTLTAADADFNATLKQATDLVANIPSDRLADTRRRAERVRDGLREISIRFESRQRESDALATVKKAATSAVALKAALRQYADACTNSDRARTFEACLENADAWAAVEKASPIVEDWADVLAPAAVPERSKAVAAALEAGETPWSTALEDYQAYLTAFDKGRAADGPWKAAFTGELKNVIYSDIEYVHVKASGKRYYVPPKVKPKPSMINQVRRGTIVPYVKKPYELTDNAAASEKFKQSVTLNLAEYDGVPRFSPQSTLRKELLAAIKTVDDGGMAGFALTDRIVQATEVDPMVRVGLLRHAVRALKETTVGGESLAEYAKAIDSFDPTDYEWMNPDNAEANTARETAEKLIVDQADVLKRARDDVAAKCQELQQTFRRHVTGRGVLLKEGPRWAVYTNDDTATNRTVVVAAGKSWETVGDYRDGKFVPVARGIADARDGSMVFFLPPATDGNAARAAK